jgi:hypothetical protein
LLPALFEKEAVAGIRTVRTKLNGGSLTIVTFTDAQRSLIGKLIEAKGSAFVRGNTVHVARRLEELGVVTVEDNGHCSLGRRSDGQRWWVKLIRGEA